MMASHADMKVGGDGPMQPEGEPDHDLMAQQIHNLFKFRNFYNQMDFSGDNVQRLQKPLLRWSICLVAQALLRGRHMDEARSRAMQQSFTKEIVRLYLSSIIDIICDNQHPQHRVEACRPRLLTGITFLFTIEAVFHITELLGSLSMCQDSEVMLGSLFH